MIISAILVVGFFLSMLYEIWIIERNKVEILTLYSYLNFNEIKEVYGTCDKFMSNLNRGSLMQDLSGQSDTVHEINDATLTQDQPS